MHSVNALEPGKREILEKTGALLKGHFRLSSGLHSEYYVQCARLFQYPEITEKIAQELASNFNNDQIDAVITPAVGGIILGYELARALKCRAMFSEREEGKMTLRRGFELRQGENVLIGEDVVTTGSSVQEIKELVKASGSEVKGFCAVVDRSLRRFTPPEKFICWLKLELQTFSPDSCPLCKDSISLIYPGSRKFS